MTLVRKDTKLRKTVNRVFPDPREATRTLRKEGYQPEMKEGRIIWVRVRNHQMEAARTRFEDGKVRVIYYREQKEG